jgi:hypothetical protein
MTVNAPLGPIAFLCSDAAPFRRRHETQWVIRSAFVRFDVDHRGGKTARDLKTMPLHFRRPSAARSTRQYSHDNADRSALSP